MLLLLKAQPSDKKLIQLQLQLQYLWYLTTANATVCKLKTYPKWISRVHCLYVFVKQTKGSKIILKVH